MVRSLLWAAALFALAASPPAFAERIGHWSFDEGAGAIATDGSSNANHGVLQVEAGGWSAGVYGLAASFPTQDHVILVPHSPTLSLPNAMTLTAWIRPEARATQYVIKKARHKYIDGFEISLSSSSGKVFARFNQASEGNTYKVFSQSDYPIDGVTWMHVAVTFDGQDIRIFIDSVLETTQSAAGLVIANVLPGFSMR